MISLEGKAALVTGAGSGLGEAIARRLVAAGAKVVLADIVAEKVRRVAADIDAEGRRTLPLAFDVADHRAVESALATCAEHFGGLDVLVNNAGVDVSAPLDELDISAWTRVINTNLHGPFLLCKLALPMLKQSGQGQIVNIASAAAVRAWPNASAYHASKWGLLGLSKALHAELRQCGIRVSSVLASGMRTPFLLERFPDLDPAKLQDPRNVAEAVHFLLTLPPESVVSEIMVLPKEETSWP